MTKKKSVVKRKQKNRPKQKMRTNHLLIIGIDQYANGIAKLNNAVRDARQFKELVVKQFQFEEKNITELYDQEATRINLLKTFRDLLNKLTDDDNLVFYYSGHGEQLEKGSGERGYWIPFDAKLNEPWTYIPNSEIIDLFKLSHAHHIFGIVDSCFSGSLFSTRNLTTAVERIDSFPSRWLLTAGRLEVVSDGSLGKNSPFATSLFTYLQKTDNNSIWVSDLCNWVLKGMHFNTDKQTPRGEPLQNVGHYGGQFVFYKKGYQPPKEKIVPPKTKPSLPLDNLPTKGIEVNRGGNRPEEAFGEVAEEAMEPETTSIDNSKNVLSNSNIQAGGNVHIGDIIQPAEPEEDFDLGPGKLIHNIPEQMKVHELSMCMVRIAKDKKILLEDLQTTSKTEIHELKKITKVMNVELVDVTGGINFNIVTGAVEQRVDETSYTEWNFFITPIRAGKHVLQLRLSTVKMVNNKERKKEISLLETIMVTTEATETQEEDVVVTPPKETTTPIINNFNDLKSYLKDLIVKDLKTALDAFRTVVNDGDSGIIQQLSRYNSNKKDFTNGIISEEQRKRTLAQITYSLNYMVDELEEDNVIPDYKSRLNPPNKIEYQDTKGNPISLDLQQLELSGLKDQATLIVEKINKIKKALILETDASQQFKYEQEIADLETKLKKIKEQLG